jgi:ketosteroid isomerase-like protein
MVFGVRGKRQGYEKGRSVRHFHEGREQERIMRERSDARPAEVIGRLHHAMNRHDLRAFLDCFDPDYRSEQPVHPTRGFRGRGQVERNWSALFNGIPDFHAELIATAAEGDTLWSEWRWTGTRAGEAPFDMRGVMLFRIEDGRIASGRLYMEEVEEVGGDIDATVRGLAEGTRAQGT